MEERRLLLAVALSLLVLTAYSLLFPQARKPATEGPKTSVAVATSPSPGPPPSPSPSPQAAAPRAAAPRAVVLADEKERRVEVTSADLNVAFTNRGGRLLSWGLPRFPDKRGRAEDLVRATPSGPRPLDIETGDEALDARLREALFRPSSENLAVDPGPSILRFEYADGDLQVEKEFGFPGHGYLVSLRVSVKRDGQEVPRRLIWGPGLGNPTPEEREVQGYQPAHGTVLTNTVERFPTAKLPSGGRILTGVHWAGLESQYFTVLFVPPGPATAVVRAFPLPPAEDGRAESAAVVALDLGASADAVLLYAGPKDYHELSGAGHRLAAVVPVGEWIGPIVVALMSLLRWVHGHVGNYGWSIVVLTVLINLVMAPFRHYSIANGLKMSKMSPEMKVIQERYRKVPLMDPKRQQMQDEMAALYAKHGMNMGSQMIVGCLPLLLTMPFLIAFYRVLSVSIELRGASFLWISDLSQKDPLFITPVLMGVSMYAMQRMMPSSLDPAQQRVMMIMPLMLSGMFLWAPAGLNLYWLASNLCSIVQQGLTLRLLRAGEAIEAREKRRK